MSRISSELRSPPVRVMVVDDSPICRALLAETLEAEGDIEVVARAEDGKSALALARLCSPALVTMDVRMPGLDGLETVSRLMAERPIPVLVVTDLPTDREATLVFDAVRRGALEVAAKPRAGDERAGSSLRARVRALAGVPVVRHLPPRTAHGREPVASLERGPVRMVAIGASAGGPAALASLLAQLPRSFPACVAIAQHLPVGFASPFARYLATRTELRVVVAERAVPAARGTVVLPPDDAHLVARGPDRLGPSEAPPQGGHRPSVDVLFRSMAEQLGSRAAGVLLTGIGRDGAEGLLAMRGAGAPTIAQDEHSSVVFGMPRAAIELGAAERVLSLEAMSSVLRELVRGGAS